MKNNYALINYKDKKYIVAETTNKIPFIFNFEDLELGAPISHSGTVGYPGKIVI
jgi:hypothetical protein